MKIEFECLEDGCWYVILPEYPGPHEDLEMVEGADKMLDALTTDGLLSVLDISLEEPEDSNYFVLEMEAHDDDGAHYNVVGCDRFSGTIWLCNVTHEVLGEHPERVFCTVIE